MPQKTRHHATTTSPRTSTQIRQTQFEAGWLGRCFGSDSNAPLNIAGLALLLLIVLGGAISLFGTPQAAQQYWAVAQPLLPVIGGFLFGQTMNRRK